MFNNFTLYSAVSAFLILASFTANALPLFNVTTGSNSITVNLNIPNHTYPYAGIKMLSSGYSLSGVGSECTMAANNYCLFSLSSVTPKTLSLSGTGLSIGFNLCLNGKGPLSCQNYQAQTSQAASHVYVVNYASNSVSLCTVDSNGSLSNCNSTGSGFNSPYSIALNNNATMAYITNANGAGIAVCSVNPSTKALTCSNFNQSGMFDAAVGIALNPSNTFAYVTNFGIDTVTVCSLTNGVLSSCVDSGQAFSGGLEGIVINPANSYAYVVHNSNNTVSKCSINSGNGTFSACVDSGATGLAFPEFISLNTAGTKAYIANGGNFVTVCAIDANTGNLNACADAGSSSSFAQPKQAVLDSISSSAYVTNSSTNLVSLCTVDVNGDFTSCVDSGGTGFNFSWGIALVYP